MFQSMTGKDFFLVKCPQGRGALTGFCKPQSSIIIPDSVTYIGRQAQADDDYSPPTFIFSDTRTVLDDIVFTCSSNKSLCDSPVVIIGENTIIQQGSEGRYFDDPKIYCTGDLEKCKHNAGKYADKVFQATIFSENGITMIKDSNGSTLASYQVKNVPISTKEVKRIFTVREANERIKELGGDMFTFKLKYK